MAALEVREGMYGLADRYQLLAPSSFAATQMLASLGQGIVPSLLSREVGPVRASLSFLSHALAPLTATEDVKKVPHADSACSASGSWPYECDLCGPYHLCRSGQRMVRHLDAECGKCYCCPESVQPLHTFSRPLVD